MKVNDTLANTDRATHDVGLAAWLGGAMFGKFAHNPSLVKQRPPRLATVPHRFERAHQSHGQCV
jgi:hypothetical protein